jgi:trehalose 6-phosphate synthase
VSDDLNVVLASNRGPISFVKRDDGFDTKRGAGGLAGALDPVARRLGDDAVWLAATTSDTDRDALRAGAVDGIADQLGYDVYLLEVDADTYSKYYDTVSNRMLWFANHCLLDEMGITEFGDDDLDAWTTGYEPVNQRFAQVVAEVAERSSLVLFQDYHLATAPGHLRKRSPDQTIFHFTHSSFCGSRDLFRLPEPIARGVVEGMLGADLLGFHVPAWAHGFMDACRHIGAEVDDSAGLVKNHGRTTWVRSYPIPIDAHEIETLARGDTATGWAERLGRRSNRLLVRADRAEPSKNIVRGFEAFGVLLDRREDLRKDVTFVACLYPSRQSMQEYRAYADAIKGAAASINERYPGSVDLFMEDDFNRTLGALSIYDVLFVNPLMDGMNLVSKEGPTINRKNGVLVLSQGAGSYDELGNDAVTIEDARDIEETATALEQAFDMPADVRTARAERLRKKARARGPDDWINAQLDDLVEIAAGRAPVTPAS